MATRKKKITRRRSQPSSVPLGGVKEERKLAHKARPFPEIIDETDWEVREGRYPSFIKRSASPEKPHIMQVPLGETPIDRKIRLHEQAHVTWTDPIREDDERLQWLHEVDTLNATEDARIIELMGRTNSEWKELNEKEVGLLTPEMQKAFQDGFGKLAAHLKGEEEAKKAGKGVIKAPSQMMNLVEAARLIASTRGYAEGHIFDQMAESADLAWVTKEVEKMHKHFITDRDPTFNDSIEYAEQLEQYFYGKQQQIEAENEALAASGMDDHWGKDGRTEGSKPVYTPPTKEVKGKGKPTVVRDGFGVKPERVRGQGRWGELTIVHKPLVDKLAAREARKVRPADVGAVPRYMHRLLTDQRVFGRRRKKKAFEGTVLIDCSGSMRLTPEDVDKILRRWPAVTVATYAGESDRGQLWIIAKKGKRARANDIKPPGGGNVVDGPCLDWLAKQRKPRVWISDGGVTGIGDDATYDFVKDAALKMKRGDIKRLGNAQALLKGGGSEEYYDYAE
jgi:hypothetical protein